MPEIVQIPGSVVLRYRWKHQASAVRVTDPMTCPGCERTISPQPIVYGRPDAELAEESERGEVWLGGCRWWPDFPTYRCRECGIGIR